MRFYLSPYRRFGMPVVWRTWTRCFPSTSPYVAAYSTASRYIKLSLQAERPLLVYILQMTVPVRAAFQPLQLRIQDIHVSRAFVWRWNFQIWLGTLVWYLPAVSVGRRNLPTPVARLVAHAGDQAQHSRK